MLSIATNLNAQQAATGISNAQNDVNKASERLTTGLRINSASDDVSGMGLATRLEKTSNQTAQYIENATNGISLIQTADAALEQQQDLIMRMQDLAFKAENGTNSTEDVALIQKEFDALALELERNTAAAEYNGINLLDGTMDTTIAIGQGDDNQIGVTVPAAGTDLTNVISGGTVAIDLKPATHGDADTYKTEVHDKLQDYADYVTETRASLGASQNRLEYSTQNLQSYKQNIDASLSNTQDADFAVETSNLAKANVLKSASQSMLSQANKDLEDVVNKLLQ